MTMPNMITNTKCAGETGLKVEFAEVPWNSLAMERQKRHLAFWRSICHHFYSAKKAL